MSQHDDSETTTARGRQAAQPLAVTAPMPAGSNAARPTHGPIPSEAVLRGRSTVEIEHNGHVYRLQTTRQGKLILTK